MVTIWEKRKEMRHMREFDYVKLKEQLWDSEILSYVAQIHE